MPVCFSCAQTCNLFEISALEQDLACSDDHVKQLRELNEMLASPEISTVDKLRLGLLYALRFETSADLPLLKERMIEGGVPRVQVTLLDKMLQYAGQAQRPPGLYGERKGFLGRIKKNLKVGLAGVENVYTRHEPLLAKVLEAQLKGALNDAHYPLLDASGAADASQDGSRPNQRMVVWMVGGTTYEESAHVASVNTASSGASVVLGGSCVHNSSSFLRELAVAPIV